MTDTPKRSTLVEDYGYLVHATLPRLLPDVPDTVEVGDLISEGFLALLAAFDGFDPGKNVKWETYAIHKIRWAMLEWVRKESGVSRRTTTLRKKLNGARDRAACRGDASDAAVSAELGVTAPTLLELREKARGPRKVALVVDPAELESHTPFAGHSQPANLDENIPLESALAGERRHLIAQALSQLTPDEQRLIALHYEEEESLVACAEQLGVPPRQMHRAAGMHQEVIGKLRAILAPHRDCFTADEDTTDVSI